MSEKAKITGKVKAKDKFKVPPEKRGKSELPYILWDICYLCRKERWVDQNSFSCKNCDEEQKELVKEEKKPEITEEIEQKIENTSSGRTAHLKILGIIEEEANKFIKDENGYKSAEYNILSTCMTCGKEEYISIGTRSCAVCDFGQENVDSMVVKEEFVTNNEKENSEKTTLSAEDEITLEEDDLVKKEVEGEKKEEETPVEILFFDNVSFEVKYEIFVEKLNIFKACDYMIIMCYKNKNEIKLIGSKNKMKRYMEIMCPIIRVPDNDGQIPVGNILEFILKVNELKKSETMIVEFDTKDIYMHSKRGESYVTPDLSDSYNKTIIESKRISNGLNIGVKVITIKRHTETDTEIIKYDNFITLSKTDFKELMTNAKKLGSNYHVFLLSKSEKFYRHVKKTDDLKLKRGVKKIIEPTSSFIKNETRLVFDSNIYELRMFIPGEFVEIRFSGEEFPVLFINKIEKFVAVLFPSVVIDEVQEEIEEPMEK